MKKQVDVRFTHPKLTDEVLNAVSKGETYRVAKGDKPGHFDMLTDDTRTYAMTFELFSDRVEHATGIRPDWVTAFGVDISEAKQNAA
jgi:hypothetical protein